MLTPVFLFIFHHQQFFLLSPLPLSRWRLNCEFALKKQYTRHIKFGQSCARTQHNKNNTKITKKGCSTILPTHPHECYIINFIPSSTMLLDNEWKVKVIHSSQQNFLYQAFCVRRWGRRRRREKNERKTAAQRFKWAREKKILITHSHIYKDTRKIERMRGIFRHRQTIEEICGEGKNPLSQSVVYNTDSLLDVKNKYSDKCKVLTLSVDSSNHSCV